MLKRKIILPNQDQRRTNSVPTPYLLRKIEICTFADGGKGVPDPPPPWVEDTGREPSTKVNFLIPILHYGTFKNWWSVRNAPRFDW